jgi:hypothetical protein
VPADGSGQVGDGAGGHARGQDDLVAGGLQGDGEAGTIGVGAGDGGGGVRDRGAKGLVGDQEGVDFLLDAVGGAGAQDAAAETGVRRFWPRRAGAGDVAAGLPPARVSVRCPP